MKKLFYILILPAFCFYLLLLAGGYRHVNYIAFLHIPSRNFLFEHDQSHKGIVRDGEDIFAIVFRKREDHFYAFLLLFSKEETDIEIEQITFNGEGLDEKVLFEDFFSSRQSVKIFADNEQWNKYSFLVAKIPTSTLTSATRQRPLNFFVRYKRGENGEIQSRFFSVEQQRGSSFVPPT